MSALRYSRAEVEQRAEVRRVGPPWARHALRRYSVHLVAAPVVTALRLRPSDPRPCPPAPPEWVDYWCETDQHAEAFARDLLAIRNAPEPTRRLIVTAPAPS